MSEAFLNLPESRQVSDLVKDFSGLVPISADRAIRIMTTQFILRLAAHGKTPEIRARANAAYRTLYPEALGVPDIDRTNPLALQGAPGHGKSSLTRAAARWVANLMGMRYRLNPADGTPITADDLVAVDWDLAGQSSAMLMGGMPAIMFMEPGQPPRLRELGEAPPDSAQEFMSFIPDYRTSLMHKAGAALLNLDDLSRAMPLIAQAGLGLLLSGQYNTMDLSPDTMVTASMNMGGSKDRTSVSNLMDDKAWPGRVQRGFLSTTPAEWARYTVATTWDKGDIRDAGMATLFGTEPFKVISDIGSGANPRSLSAATRSVAILLMAHGGLDALKEESVRYRAVSAVQADAGERAAKVFKLFAENYATALAGLTRPTNPVAAAAMTVVAGRAAVPPDNNVETALRALPEALSTTIQKVGNHLPAAGTLLLREFVGALHAKTGLARVVSATAIAGQEDSLPELPESAQKIVLEAAEQRPDAAVCIKALAEAGLSMARAASLKKQEARKPATRRRAS